MNTDCTALYTGTPFRSRTAIHTPKFELREECVSVAFRLCSTAREVCNYRHELVSVSCASRSKTDNVVPQEQYERALSRRLLSPDCTTKASEISPSVLAVSVDMPPCISEHLTWDWPRAHNRQVKKRNAATAAKILLYPPLFTPCTGHPLACTLFIAACVNNACLFRPRLGLPSCTTSWVTNKKH